jgi:hypothetical protein
LPPHFPPEVSHYIHPLDDTIPPFSAEECTLGGVRIGETKVSELAEVLGIEESELEVEVDAGSWTLYRTGNMIFTSNPRDVGQDKLVDTIRITGDVPWETPRDIQVGDTFESVLLKFPREKQYSEDEYGYFYGYLNSFMSNIPAGYVSLEERKFEIHKTIVVRTAGWIDPFIKIYFLDGKVTEFFYGYGA